MKRYSKEFGDLLSDAVEQIKVDKHDSKAKIEMDIAEATDLTIHSVRWWRKGHIPEAETIQTIARWLVKNGGLKNRPAAEQFLTSAGFGYIPTLCDELFPPPKPEPERYPLNLTPLENAQTLGSLAPFLVGKPVPHPRQFFGRTRELREIFNFCKKFPMQNIALVGERRSGKTSLMNYLQTITTTPLDQLRPGQRADWLPNPEQYHWIWVDFQTAGMCCQENLLNHLLSSLHVPAPAGCTLNQFDRLARPALQRPTLILLDEISEAFASPEIDPMLWVNLRALACESRLNLAFILTSHRPLSELRDRNERSSPFTNIFYSIELGPFPEAEARQLIGNSPLPFDEADTTWILEKSRCWPARIQIACQVRLAALENQETGEDWKITAQRRLDDYPYLKN